MPTLDEVLALEQWIFDWAGGTTTYTTKQQDDLLTSLLELREGWRMLIQGVELVERLLMKPRNFDDDGYCIFCDSTSDDPTQHEPTCPRAIAHDWMAASETLATDTPPDAP